MQARLCLQAGYRFFKFSWGFAQQSGNDFLRGYQGTVTQELGGPVASVQKRTSLGLSGFVVLERGEAMTVLLNLVAPRRQDVGSQGRYRVTERLVLPTCHKATFIESLDVIQIAFKIGVPVQR